VRGESGLEKNQAARAGRRQGFSLGDRLDGPPRNGGGCVGPQVGDCRAARRECGASARAVRLRSAEIGARCLEPVSRRGRVHRHSLHIDSQQDRFGVTTGTLLFLHWQKRLEISLRTPFSYLT
jgi:hypothetical protein